MTPVLIVILIGALVVVYVLINRQLGTIHTLVNSNLTRVRADLEIALARIETLEKLLTKK